MKLDLGAMQDRDTAAWVHAVLKKGCDPLAYLDEHGADKPKPLPIPMHVDFLRDMREACHRYSAGHNVGGALHLTKLPDPQQFENGTKMWTHVVYVCAPDLHKVEALRAVREAGSDAQEAVVSAYLLGGIDAAELLILEVMTTPGGYL